MISNQYVHRYCCEDPSLIENYNEAVTDITQVWDLHHRLEIQGDKKVSIKELKTAGLYYHRPAIELIFLTHSEHLKLHNHNYKPSNETKSKISKSHIGLQSPMKGKHHSEDTKQKMRKPKPKTNTKNYKVPKKQCKWLTPSGEIKTMDKIHAHRYHRDWKFIGEI